jgi:hypothetical protein
MNTLFICLFSVRNDPFADIYIRFIFIYLSGVLFYSKANHTLLPAAKFLLLREGVTSLYREDGARTLIIAQIVAMVVLHVRHHRQLLLQWSFLAFLLLLPMNFVLPLAQFLFLLLHLMLIALSSLDLLVILDNGFLALPSFLESNELAYNGLDLLLLSI